MYLQLDGTQTNKTCSKQAGIECVMEGNSCATGSFTGNLYSLAKPGACVSLTHPDLIRSPTYVLLCRSAITDVTVHQSNSGSTASKY